MKQAGFIAASNPKRTSTIREDEGKDVYRYDALTSDEDTPFRDEIRFSTDSDLEHHILLAQHLKRFRKNNSSRAWMVAMGVIGVFLFLYLAIVDHTVLHVTPSCEGLNGFTCSPEISHFWGQYSPYFSVPSDISAEVPYQCQITFAQVLSRHGARDPTSGKSIRYQELVDRIHANATSYSKDLAFIKNYKYSLGADQLTIFGEQQMVNSGIEFYERYKSLAQSITPFIRASGQQRVEESARNWTRGFHNARIQDSSSTANDSLPYSMVIISEEPGQNNTLDYGLCTNFQQDPIHAIGSNAQILWQAEFTPPITRRLNEALPGANLTNDDTIMLMDLCPFNTVANTHGTLHPFCTMFTTSEWHQYDYFQTLGKYYGFSLGNPLAPTQGVGFTNELIARMTSKVVIDHTSTNSTLDSSPTTFPLGASLYADFSHDNDMMTIFSALGLFNSTAPLLNTTLQNVGETHGFAASWLVPFGARAYFEKMTCVGAPEDMVRVVINDRVLPLQTCGGDGLGRCTLSAFVDSLSFARRGGFWDSCFSPEGHDRTSRMR
ncbi:probable 3-phytase B precursor [Rhynchosporium graminicola]|uniref:Phytase A n=1 Tax=Rhynchosporium graminicola TaxID=2792576 RepID=A0A1E1KUQ0_9HELO|nr:probable 3-phytase B precursor [Rhynchosporium commune]